MAKTSFLQWLRGCCAVASLGSLVGNCGSVQGPDGEGDLVLVGGGEQKGVMLVDVGRGRVVHSAGPVPRWKENFALSPDSTTLYLIAWDSSGEWLLQVDTRTLAIRRRDALQDVAARSALVGVTVSGSYGLAVTPDGQRLLVADGSYGGVAGIAVVELASLAVSDFIRLQVAPSGIAILPASSVLPSRVLVIGARQRLTVPSLDLLFVLDPTTLEVTDSVAVTAPARDKYGTLEQVLPSPQGRTVYLLGRDSLYRYDLVERRLMASVPRPRGSGRLSVAPDGQRVFAESAGDAFDFPGPGLLYVFGADLQASEPISLLAASMDGVPPTVGPSAVARDNHSVYVLSGTASRGPLFGPQPSRLLVVDADRKQLVKVVSLDDWGAHALFVVPRR